MTAMPVLAVVTLPSTPKDGSRLPSVLYRANANPAPVLPATTILPSTWIAVAAATSAPPTSVVTVPPVPNDESRSPALNPVTAADAPAPAAIDAVPITARTTAITRPTR